MTAQRFPTNLYIESPFFDEFPDSVVIPQDYKLPSPISEKEATYFDYFQNIDAHLDEIAQNVSSKSFSEWLLSLKAMEKQLIIHDIEQFDPNHDFSNYYLRFDAQYELELIPQNYHLKVLNVPKALQEVFSLGVIWVEGVPLQRCFCHPKDVTKALQKEYLQDFINDPDFQHFPLNELYTFYVDSGCWLMYDDQERVYCGGFECGDFYQTAQNLEEAISSIFEVLNNYMIDPNFGFNPSIESFITRI